VTTPTHVVVERYVASGPQRLLCNHVVDRGDVFVELRLGVEIDARSISICQDCLDGIGRLGAQR
jgi:hypothetical protein